MKVRIGKYIDKFPYDRKIDIQIHDYDIWSMDHTLSLIILPMLKKIKTAKDGVPGAMFTEAENQAWNKGKKAADLALKRATARWQKILDDMIWSFQEIHDHRSGDIGQFLKDNGKPRKEKRLEDGGLMILETGKTLDRRAYNKYEKRIQHGLDLFAKYYRNLWT